MEQVLAIGDNENDNEMLTQAGIGAAVGNAEAATKACADLTARKESGAGAAEIIRRICLPRSAESFSVSRRDTGYSISASMT